MNDIIEKISEINDIFSNQLNDEDNFIVRELIRNCLVANYNNYYYEKHYDDLINICIRINEIYN